MLFLFILWVHGFLLVVGALFGEKPIFLGKNLSTENSANKSTLNFVCFRAKYAYIPFRSRAGTWQIFRGCANLKLFYKYLE